GATPRRASWSRGLHQQRGQRVADAVRDGRAAPALAVDEHVYEPAFGGKVVLAGAEQSDAVAHAAVAQLLHAHPGIDAARERDLAQESAVRFRAQADRGAAMDVEAALGDQEGVDHRV